jgi:hypothetical protein
MGGRKALAAAAETIVRRGQTRALAGEAGRTPETPAQPQPVEQPQLAGAAA